MNQFFVRQWKDVPDVPWWYNVRASVGLLAAAVWKTGGYAFEEYSTKKKSKVGRVDLEFGTGNEAFIVEAKQCWLKGMTDIDSANRLIEKYFAAASSAIVRPWNMAPVMAGTLGQGLAAANSPPRRSPRIRRNAGFGKESDYRLTQFRVIGLEEGSHCIG